ncbi:MAG: choice-of-anchor W domain-containing protein [Planctomycetota bacterium]
MRAILAATAAIVLTAPAALAQVEGVAFGGDSDFLALTNNGGLEQAVIESRIGGGSWELAAWRFGAVGTPLDQAERTIGAGGETADFTLMYTAATNTVSFMIDGVSVGTNQVGGPFTDIFIRVRSTTDATSSVDDLFFNGVALAGIDNVGTTGAVPAEYLRITNGGANFGDFTLTGSQSLLFTGNRPTNSSLAAQFKFSNVIPAPGAATAFGLAGLAATRRRR